MRKHSSTGVSDISAAAITATPAMTLGKLVNWATVPTGPGRRKTETADGHGDTKQTQNQKAAGIFSPTAFFNLTIRTGFDI